MKIMHATEAMGGGVQNAISKYTQILPSIDHIVLGRPRDGEASGEFTSRTRVIEYQGGLVKYLLEIRRQISIERPDIVHLHSSLAGLARLLVPRNVPIAYSPHCYAFERRDRSAGWRALLWSAEWFLARRRQVLVAVSPNEAQLGKSLNSKMTVHYVPNVVTSPDVESKKNERPTVTMVGRIGAQKDPLLFAAVSRACAGQFDFHWIGDGDPDLRDELTRSGVKVSGWVKPSEARRLVGASHLYLHTGSWEAAPISAVEAAAGGIPVIARGIPTMESLGYFTVEGSVTELSKSVISFFDQEQFRRVVTDATADVASKFSPSDAFTRLSDAYADLVGFDASPRSYLTEKSSE